MLEHRVSFRITEDEWAEFQTNCQRENVTPSSVLRSDFRKRLKGGELLGDYTIEDFVYTYVDWLPGMTFGEALKEALQRDNQAANELLSSIEKGG